MKNILPFTVLTFICIIIVINQFTGCRNNRIDENRIINDTVTEKIMKEIKSYNDSLQEKYTITFSDNAGNKYIAFLDGGDRKPWKFKVLKNGKEIEEISKENLLIGRVEKFDSVRLGRDNHLSIFISEKSGGSGAMSNMLHLINLKNNKIVELSVNISFDANYLPELDRSENFYDHDVKAESNYLEKIKYDYGYYTKKDVFKNVNKTEYADNAWCLYNRNINYGKLKIIKYDFEKCKIKLPGPDEADDFLFEDRGIKYYAYFKSALEAYDTLKKEFYVVFYPRDYTCAVSKAEKYKDYLLIGTYCEGFVIINTKTFYIKRYKLGKVLVERIEVKGSKVYINDTIEIPVTEF